MGFNGDLKLGAFISSTNGIVVHGPTAPKVRGHGKIVLRTRVSVIPRGGGSAIRSFRGSPVRACVSNR